MELFQPLLLNTTKLLQLPIIISPTQSIYNTKLLQLLPHLFNIKLLQLLPDNKLIQQIFNIKLPQLFSTAKSFRPLFNAIKMLFQYICSKCLHSNPNYKLLQLFPSPFLQPQNLHL